MRHLYSFLLLLVMTVMSIGCSSTASVRVISFNLRNSSAYATNEDGDNCWMNRRPAQINMVNQEKPDLMGVQECLKEQDEYFVENLPGYGRIGVGRDDGDREGEMMTIYYNMEKLDLLCSGNFWLSETPDSVSMGWDGVCNRMVTWGCFQIKGTDQVIYHFNTHLDHMGKIAREEGVKLLVSRIKSIVPKEGTGAPLVVTGDFNTLPDDPLLLPLRELVSDTRVVAQETDDKKSYNGYGQYPSLVIDYIFEANLKPVRFTTLDGDYGVPFVSDHYPVAADLDL